MNLSVYLSELLKTNDCVIIPDLGGFIANYKTSGYDAQGDLFFPPSKEIIFSSKLKKNDGLLVNYISEREGIGYLEARKIVSESVAEYMFKLENGERIEFTEIGTLHFDQNEHLLFEADHSENLRADAFGLGSFHFPQLVNKYSHPHKPVFRDKDPEPQVRRRSTVKYLLLGLPILAVLYFIPKTISREPLIQMQTSNTASISLPATPDTKATEISTLKINSVTEVAQKVNQSEKNSSNQNSKEDVKLSMVVASTTGTLPKVVQPEETTAQTSVNESSSTGKFHVVGGCFKIRENADKLAEKLINQGYHAQVSNLGKKFYRVSVNSYLTKEEAEQTLFKLRDAEPETGYWLMVDKQ